MVNVWPNPSFEASTDPWKSNAGSDTPARSNVRAFDGSWSLYCRRGAGTSGAIAIARAEDVLTAAGDYALSVRLWIPSTITGDVGLRVTGTGVPSILRFFTEVRGDWAEVAGTFPYDGAGSCRFDIYTADPAGELWMDRLLVNDGTEPPPTPVGIDMTAAVQGTEPPRVQLTVTGIGEDVPLLTNGSFETGIDGWSPADGVTLLAAPTSDENGNPIPPTGLPPAEGSWYGYATLPTPTDATGPVVVFSQMRVAEAGATILADGQLAGTQNLPLTLRVTATSTGVPDPNTTTSDTLPADPTAWQTYDPASLKLDADHDGFLLEVLADPTGIDPATVPTLEVFADDLHAKAAGEAGTITIYRVVGSTYTPVRGIIDITPTTDTMVVNDNGAPFGVEVYYELVQTHPDGTTTTITAGPVVLTADSSWLSHPITGQGAQVTIVTWTELVYAARQNIVQVSGRAAPIVVSDKRMTPSSELVLYTAERDDLMALRELLATGDILQMRPVCDAVEPDYLAVGDVVEARYVEAGPGAGSDWRRLVTLTCQAVDQPAPAIEAIGDTLTDLHEYVPGTLADFPTTFGADATLLDIATTPLTVT